MRTFLIHIICFISCGATAQTVDTLITPLKDSVEIDFSRVRFSKDSLDAEVGYGAQDSSYFDNINKLFHLWGSAYVKYKTINLKADYIIVDFKNNVATAQGLPDSIGTPQGIPEFQDGDQQFKAQKLTYNFKTKKGIVYEVSSQQGDLYVHGHKTKFNSAAGDSTRTDDVIYNADAVFTTCNADHPHYGIRSAKQKIIPNKLIIVGTSNLEIADVPTPLVLPFGFFPITKGATAGILLPRDYEYSPVFGFGLSNIGYYTPIGEHFDMSLTTDIYFRGSFRVYARSNYRQRYRYNGNVALSYARLTQEINGTIKNEVNTSYSLLWSHTQDPKAHPYNRFSGNVNIQTNNYRSTNYNDANSVLNSSLSSNISFTRQFPNKPYSMSVGMNHSQNTNTRDMTINFPVLDFQTQSIYPFKGLKKKKGNEIWYEKILFQYRGKAQVQFNAKDTILFQPKTIENGQYGAKHSITGNTNFRILKYFSVVPSISYDEVWYFKTIQKNLNPTLIITHDTIWLNQAKNEFELRYDTTFGKIDTTNVFGFRPYRQFSASLGVNTQIFGTMQFKKGFIRGLRHVIKPSISLGYSPQSSASYFDVVDTDVRYEYNNPTRYSYFDGGLFGTPQYNGRQMLISYLLNNIFEGKYYSKKDTTTKKFKIFDNLNISGNYNLAADSFKLSAVNTNGTARFFKGITTVNLNATFDPYAIDSTGKRIDKLLWNSKKQLLRFVNFTTTITTTTSVQQLIDLFSKKSDSGGTSVASQNNAASIGDVLGNFTLNHYITFNLQAQSSGKDTFLIGNHSISTSGNIPITKGWNITLTNVGYDFRSKQLTYPDLGFRRDLHCWELGMNWQPTRGTYIFYIRVKPSSLDFLNLPYRKNNFDAAFDQ